MMRKRIAAFRWACLLAALGTLGGCLLAVGGAALGGAVVISDRRTTGIQLEDAQIVNRVNAALTDRFARESVRIDVTSYDQEVLLAGQVPREQDRTDAQAIAAAQLNVHQVYNQLSIGSMAGLSDTADDVVLAGKVKAALLEAKGLPGGVVKTTATLGNIYLQGKVSKAEADIAKQTASQVSGVKKVVALFEILSPEEYERITKPVPQQTAPAQTSSN